MPNISPKSALSLDDILSRSLPVFVGQAERLEVKVRCEGACVFRGVLGDLHHLNLGQSLPHLLPLGRVVIEIDEAVEPQVERFRQSGDRPFLGSQQIS